jgi:hypothetical protein
MNYYTGTSITLDILGSPKENLFTAFGFYSGNKNDNVIYPDRWSFPYSASGRLISQNPNQFYSTGSGFFDGNTLIKIDKPFNLNNFAVFLSFQRTRSDEEILFSSVTGNNFNNYSGYCVGINNANKLYFKYWNPVEGPFTFTFSNVIANKNLIYIYKNNSSVTIGKYNNNYKIFEKESFNIFNNSFRSSDQLFLGGSFSRNLPWVQSNNFIGYMDKFYIFEDLSLLYLNSIGSSLFSNPEWISEDPIVNCFTTGYSIFSGFSYTGITGVFPSGFVVNTTGITGYINTFSGFSYSGITGYQQNIIGFYVDNCGLQNNIYDTIPLTGLITGNVNILSGLTGLVSLTGSENINLTGMITGLTQTRITGLICVTGQSFKYVIPDYYKDNNYLASLSYNTVSFLKENLNTGNNIIEVFVENYINTELNYNVDLNTNTIEKFYINQNLYNSGDIILYKNGQALGNTGGVTGISGYITTYNPNLDYFITGDKIYTKDFNSSDFVFYDQISGDFSVFLVNGNNFNKPGFISNKFFLFRNGQKLISGRDYVETIPNTTFNLIGLSPTETGNYIMFKEYDRNLIYNSGSSGSLHLTTKFNHGCSIVYLNGLKQKIYNNYIENSDFDLISGSFILKYGLQNILNTNSNFFINI